MIWNWDARRVVEIIAGTALIVALFSVAEKRVRLDCTDCFRNCGFRLPCRIEEMAVTLIFCDADFVMLSLVEPQHVRRRYLPSLILLESSP